MICKKLVSFDLAQDREPIDVTQDREPIDVTQDRESNDVTQDRELVERLFERLIERPFYYLSRNIYGLKRDLKGLCNV